LLLAARVATPAPFRIALPRTVVPTENVTEPVGVPEPVVRVTVAVKVSLAGGVTGLGAAASVVWVVSPTVRVAKPLSTPPQVTA